jgi:hypothetical protein
MHNRKTCSVDIHLDNSLTGLQLLSRSVYVPIQPVNPSQFHQSPAITPHSQPPEHSLHFQSQFLKTSGEGQLAGCTESDNGTARSVKCGELSDS